MGCLRPYQTVVRVSKRRAEITPYDVECEADDDLVDAHVEHKAVLRFDDPGNAEVVIHLWRDLPEEVYSVTREVVVRDHPPRK